jgi:hypothetical protein
MTVQYGRALGAYTAEGEGIVTKDDALHTKQESAWQLLDEFFEAGEPGGEQELAERVSAGAKELGLPANQAERIEQAVKAALRQGTQEEGCNPHSLPVCVRIWSSSAGTGHSRSRPKAPLAGHREDQGWGFFLVQKKEDDPQAPAGESHHVVELYLYQEREHSPGRRRA